MFCSAARSDLCQGVTSTWPFQHHWNRIPMVHVKICCLQLWMSTCQYCGACRAVLDWNLLPSSKASKVVLTDMGFPVEPHSLYMAVAWGSQLKVPMYIMESGAPFDDNESGRAEFINSALEQVRHCCGNTDLVTWHTCVSIKVQCSTVWLIYNIVCTWSAVHPLTAINRVLGSVLIGVHPILTPNPDNPPKAHGQLASCTTTVQVHSCPFMSCTPCKVCTPWQGRKRWSSADLIYSRITTGKGPTHMLTVFIYQLRRLVEDCTAASSSVTKPGLFLWRLHQW